MKKFVIITDSCCDLDAETRAKYGLDLVYMRVAYEDKETGDMVDIPASPDWEIIGVKEFYNLMREGVRIRTAQVPPESYRAKYEEYLSQGYDILSISTSSGLSASYSSSLLVRDELTAKYPDNEIICIDSLTACIGLGMLCIATAIEKQNGLDLHQTAQYVEDNKRKINQMGTVEDLTYLKRAGRVSAATAIFGGLLQIKPIIVSDAKGRNVSVEKVKGRKGSIAKLAEIFGNVYRPHPHQIIGIVHADCADDAQMLVDLLVQKLPEGEKNVQIMHSYLGPIVGASSGPGMLGVYCFGKEVTLDIDNK